MRDPVLVRLGALGGASLTFLKDLVSATATHLLVRPTTPLVSWACPKGYLRRADGVRAGLNRRVVMVPLLPEDPAGDQARPSWRVTEPRLPSVCRRTTAAVIVAERG